MSFNGRSKVDLKTNVQSGIEPHPLVVVGAGISGLVCANKLARAGFGVSLIEQNNKVGGLSQGWERKIRLQNGERVRATFDLTHVVAEFLPGERWFELFREFGVDWGRVGRFTASKKVACLMAPDGEFYEILNGFEESRQQFKALYPSEVPNIDRYFALLENIHVQFQGPRFRKKGWQRTLEAVLGPALEKYYIPSALLSLITKPQFVKWHKHTQSELIDAFFSNEQIKKHLSLVSDYMGLPPSRASGLMMCLVLLSFWKSKGPVFPADGSYQKMHDELARALVECNGGTVHLGTTATGISVSQNKVTGVELKQRQNDVPRFVIAETVVIASDMKKMLLPLAAHLPQKYLKKLTEMKMAISFLSVLMVVARDGLQLDGRYADYASNMIVSSTDALEVENSRGFPDVYHIIVSFPSLVRPGAGHVSTLSGQPLDQYLRIDLSMKCPSHEMWVNLLNRDKTAYKATKAEYVAQMIDIVERRMLPGLKSALQYEISFTSATMERYCSVSEGSVYGFEQTPEQFPPYRMSPWTPIKGLYATGAGTLAGGIAGVVAAGERTADIVIRERRL